MENGGGVSACQVGRPAREAGVQADRSGGLEAREEVPLLQELHLHSHRAGLPSLRCQGSNAVRVISSAYGMCKLIRGLACNLITLPAIKRYLKRTMSSGF